MTAATMACVQGFWALDKRLAQRKQFPSVNVDSSFSHNIRQIDALLNASVDSRFGYLRAAAMKLLRDRSLILEAIGLADREALSTKSRVELFFADMLEEDFLYQNLFTSYDHTCPMTKTIGMLKWILALCDESRELIARKPLLTWDALLSILEPLVEKVRHAKFQAPFQDVDVDVDVGGDGAGLQRVFDRLCGDIDVAFVEATYC